MTEVPEGYVFEEEISLGDHDYIVIYKNKFGKLLTIGIAQSEDFHLFLKTDDFSVKTVKINGLSAEFYYSDNFSHSSTVVWTDPKTNTLCYVDGWFSEVELLKIAESISLKPSN